MRYSLHAVHPGVIGFLPHSLQGGVCAAWNRRLAVTRLGRREQPRLRAEGDGHGVRRLRHRPHHPPVRAVGAAHLVRVRVMAKVRVRVRVPVAAVAVPAGGTIVAVVGNGVVL